MSRLKNISREQLYTMNIKNKKKILLTYMAAALIAGFSLAVYRTILIQQNYDPYGASFEHGTASLFRAYEYSLIVISLILATSVFFMKKCRVQLFSARYSTTSVLVCAICGFIFAAIAILLIANYRHVIFTVYSAIPLHNVLYVCALICLFPIALYFIGCASTGMRSSGIKAYLSLSLPLFCAFYIGASYFDPDYIFYDFNRITGQLAFISMMIFMLSEANLATGHMAYGLYFASALACIVCVCAHTVPLLILVSFWEMDLTVAITTEFASIGALIYAITSAFNSIRTLEEAKPVTADKAAA